MDRLFQRCPAKARTWTLLIQSQTCCQLHYRTMWAQNYKKLQFTIYQLPFFSTDEGRPLTDDRRHVVGSDPGVGPLTTDHRQPTDVRFEV